MTRARPCGRTEHATHVGTYIGGGRLLLLLLLRSSHTRTHNIIIITHNIIRLRARPEQLLGENRFSRANSRDIGPGLWPVEIFRPGPGPDRALGRRFAALGPSRPGSARHVFRRHMLLALYLGRGIPTYLPTYCPYDCVA